MKVKKRIYHFDLYRLEQPEDLEEIGFYEYTDVEDEVVLIEWPDRFFCLYARRLFAFKNRAWR